MRMYVAGLVLSLYLAMLFDTSIVAQGQTTVATDNNVTTANNETTASPDNSTVAQDNTTDTDDSDMIGFGLNCSDSDYAAMTTSPCLIAYDKEAAISNCMVDCSVLDTLPVCLMNVTANHSLSADCVMSVAHAFMNKNDFIQDIMFNGTAMEVCNLTVSHVTQLCPNLTKLVVAEWSEWGNYSACSVTCGHGTMTRSRSCVNMASYSTTPDMAEGCMGDSTMTNTCNMDECDKDNKGHSSWSLMTYLTTSGMMLMLTLALFE